MENIKKLVASFSVGDLLEFANDSEKTIFFCDVSGKSVSDCDFDESQNLFEKLISERINEITVAHDS